MADASFLIKTLTAPRLIVAAPCKAKTQARAVSARIDWIDTLRGICIVAVAIIHTSSSCQKLRSSPDTAWFCFAELSRLLQCAVPAFLMLSAMVLTRSLLRDGSLRRYGRNRISSVLWPALLWSVLCVPYVRWLNPDIAWSNAARKVVTGEADFHLYFMRVLLQLCLVLPLLLPLLRRKPPFWKMACGTVALTLAVFFLNRFYFGLTEVASWIFWYIPPVALGVWLGYQSERWPEIARRGWPAALLFAAIGGAVYVPLALRSMAGEDVRSVFYPLGWWLYVSAASFLLFGFTSLWSETRKAKTDKDSASWLALTGRYSLQIYLLHPVVLMMLEKQMAQVTAHRYMSAGDLVILFASRLSLCLLWPLLIAWCAEKTRVSALLFGR